MGICLKNPQSHTPNLWSASGAVCRAGKSYIFVRPARGLRLRRGDPGWTHCLLVRHRRTERAVPASAVRRPRARRLRGLPGRICLEAYIILVSCVRGISLAGVTRAQQTTRKPLEVERVTVHMPTRTHVTRRHATCPAHDITTTHTTSDRTGSTISCKYE